MDSQESPEIIDLINKAKDGDELAWEKLLNQYQKLLNSTKRSIKTSYVHKEADDIDSILNLLFVESVKNYNPDRAKFSTHLVNYVKFKFLNEYLKERFIPFSNNSTKEKVLQKIKDTECYYIHDVTNGDGEDILNKFVDNEYINLKIHGEQFGIPLNIFMETVLPNVLESYDKIENAKIFNEYLKHYLNGEKCINTRIAKDLDKSVSTINKAVKETSLYLKETLKNNIGDFNVSNSIRV